MTFKPVTALLADLDIIKSHSRPKVSNDNPYSEAQFKTLKYCPVFPEKFDSLDEAETFCHHFFDYYNHRHYHAGIGLHTPFTVHIGTAQAIQHKRAETIEAFRAANPRRFTRTPALPKIPEVAWINRPDEDAVGQADLDQEEQNRRESTISQPPGTWRHPEAELGLAGEPSRVSVVPRALSRPDRCRGRSGAA
jgi:putative transposase